VKKKKTYEQGAQHNDEDCGRRDEDRQDTIMEQLKRCGSYERRAACVSSQCSDADDKQDIKSGKELPIIPLLTRLPSLLGVQGEEPIEGS
jgi:hypothetical protein